MRKKFLLMLTVLVIALGGSGKLFAEGNVANVGGTDYATIDEAIANWTNGTTLTLLADVTLSDVVTLKSTEHHTLDLGIYTMTAASGKNAIEITCEGRSSASYAITVNADATNPGGITATGKACIYYSKSDSTKDRPIIRIYNGVFNGSYSINSKSNGNTNCPQIWIYGGTFNGNVNLTKNMLRVFGGTFHGWINCTGDSSAYREISGGTFKSWQFMTADADSKFWVGTSKANYNVGCYVDDNGYLVVGGDVVTEAGETYEASSANYGGWSSYLKYSSTATNGLYYTSVEKAFADNNKSTGSVTVYVDELDMNGISYKGTIVVPEGNDITITNAPSTLKVQLADGTVLTPDANGTVATKLEVATLAELQAALESNITIPIIITAQIVIPEGETVVLDLNGKTVNSVFNGTSTTNHIYALSNKGTLTIEDSKGNGSINSRGIYNYGSLTLNAGAINAIDGNGGYAVNNQSGSTFEMNGGVVAATNEDDHQSSSGGYDATALKVPAGCTATLNGGTINNVCDFTYAIDAAGTLNIPATSTITVNGTHGAIYVSGGETTINAGTFQIPADEYNRTDNVLYVSGGSLVVNGGTFIGDSDTASGGSCLYDAAGKAVVNGGTFKGSSGGDVWGTTGTIIKGGTFENLIEQQHIAAGYELNADGTVVKIVVAKIGETPYYTLADAIAAAQTGDEIVIIANVELTETTEFPAGKTITLNLNNKKVSAADKNVVKNSGAALTIKNGTIERTGTVAGYAVNVVSGTLEVENVTIVSGLYTSGTSLVATNTNISQASASRHAIYAYNCAVTINSGTYHNDNAGNAAVFAYGSSVVTINNGTFSINNGKQTLGWTSCLLDANAGGKYVINGGEFKGHFRVQANSTMEITGGTFENTHNEAYAIYGTAVVKGGTFTDAAAQTFAKNNIADDYKLGEDGKVVYAPVVAKIGETKYETLDAAFAAATEGQTITLLADATPALTSQRAITKAAVIDLGGKTMTLTEDDLYFGTTTFKNGTIVVDPSVKPSTAVFWMFANQTLTFDAVKVVATGVTGTYLIGLDGNNSDLNLINGSEILVENTTALDLDIICVNASTGNDIKVENSKVNVTNLDGRVFFRGNYTVSGTSEVNLEGITKAGFRIEAGQTLTIADNAIVNIVGEPRDGGIHLTDLSATYTKAETATVNATVNEPKVAKVGENTYRTLAQAVAAVEDGGTITLIANETFTKTNRTHNSGTWYDGLYYVGDKSFTIDLGGFTISQDGAVNDYLLNFKNSGSKANTITLKNGTIDAGTAAFCAICTSSSQANELTINTEDINIINNISNGSTIKLRGGAVLNVKGGTKITGKNSYLGIECVASTVNIYDGAEIYMNGTTSYNGCLVGACGGGTVNVYGGYGKGVKGGFIAMTSGGTINVEGGEWIANTDGTVGNNSNVYVLTAQSNINEQGFVGPAIINVTGGTFRGGMDAWVFNNHKDEKAELNISGGNFNAKPTSYVAEDYIAVENNGVWNVVKAAAKIDKQGYATIKDAVAAVKESETITILAGTHSEGIIKLPATLKNVTLKGVEGAILKDMTISAADGNSYSYVNLTFDGITFDNSRLLFTGWRNGEETIENLTVTNCTFKNLYDTTNTAPVHINKDASEAVENFTFTNNVIDGATGGSKSGIYAQVTGDVVVENNIINNVSFRPYVIQVTTDDGIADNFTVKGNTFSGSAAGRAQGLGNNAEGTDDVTLVVSNNIFKNITNSQQICYWNFNAEKTTADLSGNYYDIDIVANPGKIYYNAAAANIGDLVIMDIFPIYTALNEDGTIDLNSAFTVNGVSTKAELNAAIASAEEGATIVMIADIDYGTDQLKIEKDITLDLGGKTLTTQNAYGGMSVKNNPTIKNGTIVHKSNTAAIKVWNATAFEDLVIDVQGKGDANKTIGGIVLQSGSTTRVGLIKNVTIKGAALTNGIETYNCGDATENVIGAMENVAINAQGTGLLISAPCGTATNCDIKGGVNGIEIWIKGNYSASLELVASTVEGGVYAHDEINNNPGVVNEGTLKFTADDATIGASAADVTLEIARVEAEKVQGVLNDVMVNAKAKLNNVYYATFAEAFAAAKAGDVVTVFAGTYAMPTMKAGITIVGEGDVLFEGTLTGTLENLTMKNIHIKGGNAQRWAYAKGDLVFENVTFEATSIYALHFDGITAGATLTYKDCTIIGWAAMSGSPESCTFDGCTFMGNGTYGLIRTYFDATITDCTFDVANVNTNDVYQDGIHAVSGAEVTVTNCTNANGDMKDLVNVTDTSVVTVDDVVIKNVVKVNDNYYRTLAEAIDAIGLGDVVIELLDNATLNYGAREAYGTAETTSLTINGNGKVLTLNQTNSDWSSFGLANAGAKVEFNNMTIEKTGHGDTNGAWNTHAIIFSSNVEMNEVTVNNAIAVQAGATLNNVTINEANGYYGLWINGNGQTVTMEGGSITATNGGRGIKIADQYIDKPAQVRLEVTRTVFTTAKKAAVLVSSKAGAKIDASSVDITYVAEDTENFVWVDEDWAANYGNVEVTGAEVAQEGIKNFVAEVKKDDKVQAYYKDLKDAFAAAGDGENTTVKLLCDIDLASAEWTPVNFNGVFDGQNHTISNLVVNGGSNSNQGFFGTTQNGEIKNVTFDNAKVTGRLNVGVVAGQPYTSKYTNVKVTGHVEVNGMAYVGGVGGKNAYANWTDITVDVDATSYVEANSVENGTAYRTYVGGVVGFNGEGGHTFKNISSNIKVIGSTMDIGGIFGIAHYSNKFENIKFTGSVEAPESAKEVGGIAGVWHNEKGTSVTFTNCTSEGTVKVGDVTTTGSIVGAAYNAANETEENSGSLIIDGKESWLKVAQVGEVKYLTLAEAVAAVTENTTITMLADVELTSTVTVAKGQVVTLNLNGKTISAAITEQLTKSFEAIQNRGTLTVKDSATTRATGRITVSYAGTTFGYGIGLYTISNEGGVLNIESGIVENTTTVSGSMYDAIDNNSTLGETVLNITGGEVRCPGYIGVRQFANSTTHENIVNVTGGKVVGGNTSIWMQNPISGNPKATIAISGDANIEGRLLAGTSTGFTFNVTGGTFTVDPSDYLSAEFDAIETNGTWVVKQVSGTQTREFTRGWNWFSSYVDLSQQGGLEKLQTALGESGLQIKAQNKNQSVVYQHIGNNIYDWIGDLDLSAGKMYMVNTSAAVSASISGGFVDYENEALLLKSGWNWISYPLNQEVDINTALQNLVATQGDNIKGYGTTSIATYYNGKWVGPLATLKPGQGYMYQSAKQTSFVYSTEGNTANASKSNVSAEETYWTPSMSEYANNMVVFATLRSGEMSDNYEVAAFANGECRGSARPIYIEQLDQYMLFMTIYGDEVEEMTFKCYDVNNGTEYDLINRMVYSNDAVVGSLDEPYIFTCSTTGIGEATLSDINIYPNPTTTDREINLQATCDKVEVFNTLGVKVAEYQNVDTIDALETAGTYVIRVTLNGDVKHCRLVVK